MNALIFYFFCTIISFGWGVCLKGFGQRHVQSWASTVRAKIQTDGLDSWGHLSSKSFAYLDIDWTV